MKRYSIDGGIPTLAVALSEHMTAGELRKLASLTGGPVPTRKAELAALIASDTRTRRHCLRAGERHLVVPASSDAAFRHALRDLGFLLASGETRVPKGRRANTSAEPAPRWA